MTLTVAVDRLAKAIEEFPSAWQRMIHGERPLSEAELSKEMSRQLYEDSFTKP